LRFTQFYNTARCWPTRAALLTGYYAQQVRRDALPSAFPAAPAACGRRGRGSCPTSPGRWAIAATIRGKWHVDGPVLAGGFDRSYQLQDNYFHPRQRARRPCRSSPRGSGRRLLHHHAIADHAIACLKDHAASTPIARSSPTSPSPRRTFRCTPCPRTSPAIATATSTAGTKLARSALPACARLGLVRTALSKVERDVGPPYDFPDAFEKLGPGEVNRPLPWDAFTDEQRRFQATKMAIHAAMVDRMDREIGRMLDQLKAMGAFEDTLILFASDNGASAEIMVRGDGHDPQADPGRPRPTSASAPGWSSAANTPFRRHKTWVHEGGISTPLVVHWPPGSSRPGRAAPHAGPRDRPRPDTCSRSSTHRSPHAGQGTPPCPGNEPRAALAATCRSRAIFSGGSHEGNRAIRVGDWKLVAAGAEAAWELFNLAADRRLCSRTNFASRPATSGWSMNCYN
jgi:arylsulfatase A-like enzyme